MARRRKKIDTAEYTAEITDLSHEGRGIAHVNDKTTFIFNALPDETVRFKYTKKRNQIAEGASTEILTPSKDRIMPHCPNFTICGGCSLQHMTAEFQREFKRNSVLDLLKNQGVTPEALLPTLTGPEWHYRRKARIGVKFLEQKDSVLLGFRERNSSFIAHMDECHVLDARIGLSITTLKAFIYSLDARSAIPQLEIAATDDEVALIIRHLEPLSNSDIDRIKQFASTHSFKIYLQPKGIDSITLLTGTTETLSYTIPEFNLTYQFLPFQFTQVNETINRKMLSQAIDLLDIQAQDRVLDLFCGIGNFSLAAATQAKQVIGVEAEPLAIEFAKKNAALNSLVNCEFFTANLFEDCTALSWARETYNKILLDPPRSGADNILSLLPAWQPQKIVYVSCNPATFARDSAQLKGLGYTLAQLSTMDMFPHTQHTEVMGLFTKAID